MFRRLFDNYWHLCLHLKLLEHNFPPYTIKIESINFSTTVSNFNYMNFLTLTIIAVEVISTDELALKLFG